MREQFWSTLKPILAAHLQLPLSVVVLMGVSGNLEGPWLFCVQMNAVQPLKLLIGKAFEEDDDAMKWCLLAPSMGILSP